MTKLFIHPKYQREFNRWKLYSEIFDGDDALMRSKHLVQFELEKTVEGKKAYAQRRVRTFYTNFAEPIISVPISTLFKFPIRNLEQLEPILTKEETRDFDGFGNSFEQWLKKLAQMYLIYGDFFAGVDSPSADVVSEAEARAKGIRPYALLFSPLDVPDWEIASDISPRRGALEALHAYESRLSPRETLEEEPHERIYRKEYALRDGVYQIREYSTSQERQLNESYESFITRLVTTIGTSTSNWEPFGEVKIIAEIEELPFIYGLGRSWLKEVTPLILRYYNIDSIHDNILYYQGYTRVAVAKGDNATPPPSEQAAGENTVWWLPPGSQLFPITAETATGVADKLTDLRNSIFRLGFNQPRQLDGGSQQVQSAETIREEKEFTHSLYRELAQDIEDFANALLRHWAAFKRRGDFEPAIELNKDFTSQDYDDFIKLYTATFAERKLNPDLNKSFLKKAVALGNFGDSETEMLNESIENNVVLETPPPIGQTLTSRFLTNGNSRPQA